MKRSPHLFGNSVQADKSSWPTPEAFRSVWPEGVHLHQEAAPRARVSRVLVAVIAAKALVLAALFIRFFVW